MKILAVPHKPKHPCSFWCHDCDHQLVDSENESSGKFFVFFGHRYDPRSKEYDGSYEAVMFAICKPCSDLVNT